MSNYYEKIKKAVSIIEKNLSKKLYWKNISRECGISEFHFHRIFCAAMNETPKEFIIRRRLECSMSKIAYGNNRETLCEIALECGYSSQSNFNKAFKSYFGVTPKQVQNGRDPTNSKIGTIKSKYGKKFTIENLYPREEINDDFKKNEVVMKVKIEQLPKRRVIYNSSKQGYKKESIREAWNELMTNLASLGNDMDSLTKFGIAHDNPQATPEGKCRYDACVLNDDLKEVPKLAESMDLPEGKYACFYFKGNGKNLLDLYLQIYSSWFSDNGYELGDFPLIEKYIYVNKDNPSADIELETQFLLK